jgi:predicted enzyme related to lactoylglutathione lyase
MDNQPILGLRTALYRVTDLEKAKDWYRSVLGVDPYFDEPFYVGFNVGGFELGLDPDLSEGPTGPGGVGAYWGVADAEAAFARLLELGGREHSAVKDVGGGIKVASVLDPSGNVFGIIENPHFKIEGPALPNPEA